MHRGRYLTRPDRDLDHIPMVLLVQRKRSLLISYRINCNNCQYNRQRPTIPLFWLLPLLKRRMYTVCNRQTRRPPSSLTERRNNERGVRGIRNLPIMLVGATQKGRSRSVRVIFARKTIQLTSALGLQRPRSYWHINNLSC